MPAPESTNSLLDVKKACRGLTLGIDLACRAAHVASLAGPDGVLVWTGRKFFTRPADLERLWADLDLADPAELTVVIEPTRNAWCAGRGWFRSRGARVVMVPTTQSAELRAYYFKHTKNDRLDSAMLARLPLMHPEGLREYLGDGPADPLRRVARQRASMVKRRTAVFSRIDALLELLGPAWYAALGSDYGNAALALLGPLRRPERLLRLGPARLTRFLKPSHAAHWATRRPRRCWPRPGSRSSCGEPDGIDFAALAADIAVEAKQAVCLTEQIKELDQRIDAASTPGRPRPGDRRSAPGVGPVIAGVDRRPARRPAPVHQPGRGPLLLRAGPQGQPVRHPPNPDLAAHQGRRPIAARDAVHRRRPRPQGRSAARRQVRPADARPAATTTPRSATSPTTLLTRIAACWRTGQPYASRDVDGRADHRSRRPPHRQEQHQVDPKIRARNASTRKSQRRKQGRAGSHRSR